MASDAEREFERIVDDCLSEMEAVDCPMAEFRDALESAYQRFQERHLMVVSELSGKDEDEESESDE